MKIQSVAITNLKGIASLRFEVGALTVIAGENGVGKTSILDALRTVFEGGHDPALVRNGADKGSIVIDLSTGHQITKTITAKSYTLKVASPDGSIVPAPAKFVERLAAGFAYDPLAFLDAPPKKRLEYLLSAMPLYWTAEEIEAAGGGRPAGQLDIEGLDAYRAGVYERRRVVNAQIKEFDGTVAALSGSLPEAVDGMAQARVVELREKWAAIQDEGRERAAVIAQWEADEMRQIREEMEARMNDVRTLAAKQKAEIASEIAALAETVSHDLGEAEAIAKLAVQAEQTRANIETFRARSKALVSEQLALAAQLEAIDSIKKRKLDSAAIPGVETRDGEIRYNGVPLDHVNTQQQYFLAFQLAALKAGELGFMICDHGEAIVGENWAEFCDAAKASGYQVIVARAEHGGPLKIEAIGQ